MWRANHLVGGQFVELVVKRTCFLDCVRAVSHYGCETALRLELLFQVGGGYFHARVHFYGERRAEGMAVGGETHGVFAGHGWRAERHARRVVRDGGDGIFMAQGIRRAVVEIPDPAVHSGVGGKSAKWPHPVNGDELFFQLLLGQFRLVRAGIARGPHCRGHLKFPE